MEMRMSYVREIQKNSSLLDAEVKLRRRKARQNKEWV